MRFIVAVEDFFTHRNRHRTDELVSAGEGQQEPSHHHDLAAVGVNGRRLGCHLGGREVDALPRHAASAGGWVERQEMRMDK